VCCFFRTYHEVRLPTTTLALVNDPAARVNYGTSGGARELLLDGEKIEVNEPSLGAFGNA
jgi:hypothetical protein